MRGVGQTKYMVYNLPNERCILVTPNHAIGKSIEKFIQEARGKDSAKKIKVINISKIEDTYKLLGSSCQIFFDHSFFDLSDEETVRKALEYAYTSSVVYHTHKGNFK